MDDFLDDEDTGEKWSKGKVLSFCIIIGAVIISSLCVLIMSAMYTNSKVNEVLEQAKEEVGGQVSYTVKSYLSSFREGETDTESASLEKESEDTEKVVTEQVGHVTTNTTTETVKETTTMPSVIYSLTDEQIEKISQMVAKMVKEDIVKEVLNGSAEALDKELASFEKEIYQYMNSLVGSNQTPTFSTAAKELSEDEIDMLTESISAVVKADILSVVKERYYEVNAVNIEALRLSLRNNMDNIEAKFAKYDKKFENLNAEISVINSKLKVAGTDTSTLEEELKQTSMELLQLTKSFNFFTSQALTTSMLVDSLEQADALPEDGVLTVSAGKEILTKIESTQNDLKNLTGVLNSSVLSLEKSLTSTMETGDQSVRDSLVETATAINEQVAEGDTQLQSQLEENKEQLEESLTTTSNSLSEDITTLEDNLNRVNQSLGTSLSSVVEVLGESEISSYSYTKTVLSRVADLETKVVGASGEISVLCADLQALETRMTALENKVADDLNLKVSRYDATSRTAYVEMLSD